ncbi:hypothetical protein J1605_007032 [Eschrichtius robustus]|uniref:Uncharacterized protein n=1 Tax=Eschrichtius robustus TaxID=9764 RepID=A0AB34H3F0_ESCRO|nr:hypothetical protein J1605_007032 [Eschrichtius robustus]
MLLPFHRQWGVPSARRRIAMAARGGVATAGEGLRYAEDSPPPTKRSDTDIDRRLVSLPALLPFSRSKLPEPTR